MPEALFERELEIFRTEADAGAQLLSAFLAVHNTLASSKPVYRLLNEAPLFWNTSLGALQTGAFIALGRMFDQKSNHNLDVLLKVAERNPGIFSRAALGRRRQEAKPDQPEWLADFLRDAYEPTPQDFRSIRKCVNAWRKIYNRNYRDIRHKVFAHREVSDRIESDALFAKTNVGELQGMFSFLGTLHQELWQLYQNGRKPDLSGPASRNLQERIATEAEQFLIAVADKNSTETPKR